MMSGSAGLSSVSLIHGPGVPSSPRWLERPPIVLSRNTNPARVSRDLPQPIQQCSCVGPRESSPALAADGRLAGLAGLGRSIIDAGIPATWSRHSACKVLNEAGNGKLHELLAGPPQPIAGRAEAGDVAVDEQFAHDRVQAGGCRQAGTVRAPSPGRRRPRCSRRTRCGCRRRSAKRRNAIISRRSSGGSRAVRISPCRAPRAARMATAA